MHISCKTKYDLSKINSLVKELKVPATIQIGVFADKAQRKSEESEKEHLTNADIAQIHEFGSILRNIPERSFLRMPIFYKRNEIAKSFKNILRKAFMNPKQVSKQKILKDFGGVLEGIVQDAFTAEGWGHWPALSPITIAKKGFNVILTHTRQLRRSITSRVVRK